MSKTQPIQLQENFELPPASSSSRGRPPGRGTLYTEIREALSRASVGQGITVPFSRRARACAFLAARYLGISVTTRRVNSIRARMENPRLPDLLAIQRVKGTRNK